MFELFNEGCQLALPVVTGKGEPLVFRAWRPGDPLELGVFKTLHPSPRREVVEPDALIVRCSPATRRAGGWLRWRLLRPDFARACGSGGKSRVGVAFDDQLVAEEVPHGPDTSGFDWLLTDRPRLRVCLNHEALFCGDVVGRSGREAVLKHVPKLRQDLGLDFVV